MGTTPQDTYQLAGLDPRERGFSRPVEVVHEGQQYRVLLRYEAARIVTEPATSQDAALQLLITALHGQGYRQLKTQVSFSNGAYLGSRESWTEYSDPPPPHRSLCATIRSWFQRDHVSA